MTDHRESLANGTEVPGGTSAASSRRFARLVGSPAARRVALPRLIAAVAVSIGVVWLAVFGTRSLIGWVASGADHQLAFANIELDPPPDPWIVGGRRRILEQVRAEAKLPEMLPILELDLKSLRNDFRRCPWVKDVTRVERSYRRLTVHLVYRKPVAVVVLAKAGENAYAIDEQAVPLPRDDVDWRAKSPRIQVRGISDPLIEIRGVPSASGNLQRFGVPWKMRDVSGTLVDDPMVLGAARLADLLQRRPKTTPEGRKAPGFAAIWLPDEPIGSYYLIDVDENRVKWGEAPGSEKPGDPSAEARWKMLLEWVDRHGSIGAKSPNYLHFTRTEAELVRRPAPPRRLPAPR